MTTFRRDAKETDPGSVARLLGATGFFSEAEVEIGAELVEESLARGEAAGYHYLFADALVRDGAEPSLSGYCCFGEIPLTQGSFDLYWIAVSPDAQGSGLGTALLEAAEREMAKLGARRVFVDTSGRQQYEPTRRFYEARGYLVAARLEDFYATGDDKVVYFRRLPPPA